MISLELLVGIRKKGLSGTEDYAKKKTTTHTQKGRDDKERQRKRMIDFWEYYLSVWMQWCLNSWIIVFNANKLFM